MTDRRRSKGGVFLRRHGTSLVTATSVDAGLDFLALSPEESSEIDIESA